jgi:hypothetical protein
MDDTIRRHHGQVPGSAALDGRSSAMAGGLLFFDTVGVPGRAPHDMPGGGSGPGRRVRRGERALIVQPA